MTLARSRARAVMPLAEVDSRHGQTARPLRLKPRPRWLRAGQVRGLQRRRSAQGQQRRLLGVRRRCSTESLPHVPWQRLRAREEGVLGRPSRPCLQFQPRARHPRGQRASSAVGWPSRRDDPTACIQPRIISYVSRQTAFDPTTRITASGHGSASVTLVIRRALVTVAGTQPTRGNGASPKHGPAMIGRSTEGDDDASPLGDGPHAASRERPAAVAGDRLRQEEAGETCASVDSRGTGWR